MFVITVGITASNRLRKILKVQRKIIFVLFEKFFKSL